MYTYSYMDWNENMLTIIDKWKLFHSVSMGVDEEGWKISEGKISENSLNKYLTVICIFSRNSIDNFYNLNICTVGYLASIRTIHKSCLQGWKSPPTLDAEK